MKFFPKTKKINKQKEDEDESKTKKDQPIGPNRDDKLQNSSPNTIHQKKNLRSFTGILGGKKNDLVTDNEVNLIKDDKNSSTKSISKNVAVENKFIESLPRKYQTESGITENMSTEKISKLIEIISATKENAITPVINFEENKIFYPLLKEIEEDESNISFLEKLTSPGFDILEKDVYDRLLVCPEHKENFSVSLRLYCSSCNSLDLTKLQLLEHKTCGYIGERKEFGILADDNKITSCPGCGKTIRDMGKEVRKLGMWYQCNKCKTKFDNPIMKFRCRKFDHDFDINQSDAVIIPSYKPKKVSKTISNYLVSLIPQVKRVLVLHGLNVHDSTSIKGKSGVSHQVSIFADDRKDKTVLIDIRGSETEIEDNVMDSVLTKVLDISPSVAIFVGVPSISDRARTMATTLNISVVTSQNFTDIISQVEGILKARLARTDLPAI